MYLLKGEIEELRTDSPRDNCDIKNVKKCKRFNPLPPREIVTFFTKFFEDTAARICTI